MIVWRDEERKQIQRERQTDREKGKGGGGRGDIQKRDVKIEGKNRAKA